MNDRRLSHFRDWSVARRVSATLLLAASLSGCSIPAKPLLMPVESIRSQFHTACITELSVEVGVVHADQRLPLILGHMREALTDAGFHVAEDEKLKAVKNRVFQSMGRVWDPDTGVRDDALYAKAQAAYYEALHRELGCDTMVSSRVVVVTTQVYGGVAKWDGVKIPVSGLDFGSSGWVSALSFWISLHDVQQREIYFNTGGIQVLVDFQQDSILVQPEAVPTADENVLAYDANNRRAVRTALDSFLNPSAKRVSF